jgi:hypothetical protein
MAFSTVESEIRQQTSSWLVEPLPLRFEQKDSKNNDLRIFGNIEALNNLGFCNTQKLRSSDVLNSVKITKYEPLSRISLQISDWWHNMVTMFEEGKMLRQRAAATALISLTGIRYGMHWKLRHCIQLDWKLVSGHGHHRFQMSLLAFATFPWSISVRFRAISWFQIIIDESLDGIIARCP